MNKLLSIIKEVLHFVSYAITAFIAFKIFKNDGAEVKATRARIKSLLAKKERLESKEHQEKVNEKIKAMVPKDKLSMFNDLISKL